MLVVIFVHGFINIYKNFNKYFKNKLLTSNRLKKNIYKNNRETKYIGLKIG